MNYELAKELKDTGLPQDRSPWVYYICQTSGHDPHTIFALRNGLSGYKSEEVIGWVAAPTLEELIEACGKTYVEGGKEYSFGLLWALDKWFAGFTDEHDCPTPELSNGEATTPTEAVARLWIALNKKS